MNQHADFRTYVPLTNGWDQYRQGYAGRSLRQLVETEKVHEAVPKVPLVVIETCLHNDLGQNLTPAERRGYLDFLANYFQGRGSMTVFMSSNPRGYGTDPFVNGNGHTWMDLFEDEKAFCELKGYEYIDQYTPWESERVRRGYDRTKMYLVVNGQPDLIHPDDEGYDIMATTLKRAICGVEYGYGNPY
ncbi:SGNH/GDSL hydrolase family protein [Paenibacillus tianmuensis]|nr:hypothetical protein [Paenibacillus tianmuensis]